MKKIRNIINIFFNKRQLKSIVSAMNCVNFDISNFEIYFHPGMMKKSGPVAFVVEKFLVIYG